MLDIFWFGKWQLEVDAVRGAWSIRSPGPNDEKQYYEVVPGAYGEPIIVAEPDLAFDPPANLRYVNAEGDGVKPDQKIARVILKDTEPSISCWLTNAKRMGKEITVNEDGSLQIGAEKWWIVTLFLKDKNLFRGYDAFCAREPLSIVTVLELEDLALFLC